MTARSQIRPFVANTAPQFRYESGNEDQFRRELERWCKVLVEAVVNDPTGPSGGGALPTGVAIGDLLYGIAVDTWGRLAIGSSGQYLRAGASTPVWTSGSTLSKTDDTNVTLTLGGSPTNALLNATSLTLGWTGTLGATRGGTGTGTVAVGDVLYGSGVDTWSKLAANATGSNLFLRSVSSGAPSWAAVTFPDIGGNISYAQLPTGGGTWANGGALSITGGVTTVAGLTSTENATITSTKALLWSADNGAGSTVGASGASRPYGGYFGTELVIGDDPGGSDSLRLTGGIDVVGNHYRLTRYAATPDFTQRRAQGTASSPTALGSGQTIGQDQFSGYDGVTPGSFTTVAGLQATTTEAWDSTHHEVRLTYTLWRDSSAARVNVASIFPSGNMRIGSSTTDPSVAVGWLGVEGGCGPMTDNAVDSARSGTRWSTVYGYTGDFTTRVTAPIFGTTTAADTVLQRNSAARYTLGSALNTVAVPEAYSINTPSQIVADQNNYALPTATYVRLSTDATRTITGFAAGTDGERRCIVNVGSNWLNISNLSASSSAANQVITGTGATLTLTATEMVWMWYDGTSSKWRIE